MTFDTLAGSEDQTAKQLSQAHRMVSSAVVVLSATLAIALVSYLWDWWDAIDEGGVPEPDEWLGLVGLAWLPFAAVFTVRLVRVQRSLAARTRAVWQAFADTVDTAHGWVWQADADLRLTFSSDGVQALLGRPAGQLGGRSVLEVLEVTGELTGTVDATGRQDWVTRAMHQDGSVRYLSTTIAEVRDDAGRVLAYRGFSADVTAETVAGAAHTERHQRYETARARIERAMREPSAMQMMLQPIADLHHRRIAGMEALARFSDEPQRPPNLWFAEA